MSANALLFSSGKLKEDSPEKVFCTESIITKMRIHIQNYSTNR